MRYGGFLRIVSARGGFRGGFRPGEHDPAVGGALGLGVLVAVKGTAVRHAVGHPLAGLNPAAQAQHVVTHGIATAFGFVAILNVCSLLVIIALIRPGRLAPAAAPAPRPQEETIAS